MDALKSLLPPGDGYLPYYILVVSAMRSAMRSPSPSLPSCPFRVRT